MHWLSRLEGGPRRVNHAAVGVGHKIYTFGGYCTGENSREYASMDVHVLNTTTFRWTKHPVSDLPYFENDDILPYKRYGHTAVIYKDKVYIWGGRNDRTSCATLFCFDTAWHCWTAPKTRGSIPPARDGHTACVWRHYMFIFGGYEEVNEAFSRTVYSLDFNTMRWSYVSTQGRDPPVRDFHTVVVYEDKMFVFGGRGTFLDNAHGGMVYEDYSNTLWYLDLKTFHWHKVSVTGDEPKGRRSHSAFVYKDKMYIFGGYNATERQHMNDMYALDLKSYHWQKIMPRGEPPVERRRQACILVDSRVFLFGGTSPETSRLAPNSDLDEEDTLVDHSDTHILDLDPSLTTLCMLAVRKYMLDESVLPTVLRKSIQDMFMPNKITLTRPSNSAG